MITLSIPEALDLSMMVLRAGISTSQPSRPKRFSEDHFLARKSSNLDRKTSVDSWQDDLRCYEGDSQKVTIWNDLYHPESEGGGNAPVNNSTISAVCKLD